MRYQESIRKNTEKYGHVYSLFLLGNVAKLVYYGRAIMNYQLRKL